MGNLSGYIHVLNKKYNEHDLLYYNKAYSAINLKILISKWENTVYIITIEEDLPEFVKYTIRRPMQFHKMNNGDEIVGKYKFSIDITLQDFITSPKKVREEFRWAGPSLQFGDYIHEILKTDDGKINLICYNIIYKILTTIGKIK
jgi:hypothetical protein